MKAQAISKLIGRICLEYGFTQEAAQKKAMQVLERCPTALLQNVEEWSDGQKLTDIFIGRYSLPMILAIWNSKDFLRALEVMAELDEGSIETAELRIWNMRR